jgi:hypothetical protein
MTELTTSARTAIQNAYESVLNMEPGSDSIAFEAAVMIYRRLAPEVEEADARDRVASVIAEGVSDTVMAWTRQARSAAGQDPA